MATSIETHSDNYKNSFKILLPKKSQPENSTKLKKGEEKKLLGAKIAFLH